MAMDEQERVPDEELVEDLDPPEEEAENVKGGVYHTLKVEGTGPPPPPRP